MSVIDATRVAQRCVRRLMTARGMGFTDLAAATGRSQPDVYRSLTARHRDGWTLRRLQDYAKALGVEPAELLRRNQRRARHAA